MDLLSGIYYTYLYIIIEIIQTLPVIISHIINGITELLLHGKLYRGSSECPWDTTTISAETKYLILHLTVFPFLPCLPPPQAFAAVHQLNQPVCASSHWRCNPSRAKWYLPTIKKEFSMPPAHWWLSCHPMANTCSQCPSLEPLGSSCRLILLLLHPSALSKD